MLEQKKENLINILEKLAGKWDKAEGLIVLINNTNDEKLVDTLIEIIKSGMETIKDEKTKQKMSETLSVLEKMKEEERLDEENDLLEADELLKDLD